jgi:hypothetical protein
MTHTIYMTLSAVGNVGKTTVAHHVLASAADGSVCTLETHSASGDERDVIDRDGLAARLFAPPESGLVLDVGVGDIVDAIEAMALVARQDTSLSARLRIVVPLLVGGKSIAGLRWLLGQMPESLRGSVRALWNRVRSGEESAVRESDLTRAARAIIRQVSGRLCVPVLHESPLFDPMHPLVRGRGSLGAVASISDTEIRSAPLAEIPALLAGRDAAQSAQADCREALAAIDK